MLVVRWYYIVYRFVYNQMENREVFYVGSNGFVDCM
jgi:hypothetical protein